MMGTAMLTRLVRTSEKVHRAAEAAEGSVAWRSTNISTSTPIISAIEAIPTDQATLEAVLRFITGFDSVPRAGRREACGLDSVEGPPHEPHGCQHHQPRAFACGPADGAARQAAVR